MDIKKPQLVKVGAFAYFFEGVLQHPRVARSPDLRSSAMNCDAVIYMDAINHIRPAVIRGRNLLCPCLVSDLAIVFQNIFYMIDV